MLRIDETPPQVAVERFSSQVIHIAPRVRHFLDESIVGDQSKEFYQGLLAGLMFSYQLYEGSANAKEVNVCTLALIAKLIKEK